jgi:squalene-associated FAD-dependent desaturase
VDNGQHVFLRCCEAYRWLLRRIGATDKTRLQDRLDIAVLDPSGRRGQLRRAPGVPAPAHLGGALRRYGLLSPLDRARAVRGALALRMLDPADARLDARTLGGFLRRHGQNDETISALWGVVATATLNLHPDDASLALAAKVFRTGLLDGAGAADVGYATAPLGAVHHDAAGRALRVAGVEVRLGRKVVRVESGRVHLGGDDAGYTAEAIVLAVPYRDAFTLLPGLADGPAAGAQGLGATAIVNVHVVYDRQVTDLPFAAAVRSPAQWIFDRTDSSGLRATVPGGQYLAVTVSAADGIVDVPARELTARYVAELARLFPAATDAHVLDAFVTRERRATFRQSAGHAVLRPAADDAPDGVWLAGSWTATGWPDTMESAVRSGVHAAERSIRTRPPETWGFAA